MSNSTTAATASIRRLRRLRLRHQVLDQMDRLVFNFAGMSLACWPVTNICVEATTPEVRQTMREDLERRRAVRALEYHLAEVAEGLQRTAAR